MDGLNLGGREIVVVDDVRFTRLTVVKMLAGLGGPTVHEAEDGQAALQLLADLGTRVDCVISDLDMPRLDGLGLLRAIRVGTGAIPRTLPVVILTGHSEFERLGPALLLDLDAFLAKPVSKTAIERCLSGLLAGLRGDGASGSSASRRIAAAETYRALELSAAAAVAGTPGERRVALAELSPGAVLARDLLFDNGRLLLPAQTRLSAGTVARLMEIAAVSALAHEAWIVQ